jgi:hypothetical protein
VSTGAAQGTRGARASRAQHSAAPSAPAASAVRPSTPASGRAARPRGAHGLGPAPAQQLGAGQPGRRRGRGSAGALGGSLPPSGSKGRPAPPLQVDALAAGLAEGSPGGWQYLGCDTSIAPGLDTPAMTASYEALLGR